MMRTMIRKAGEQAGKEVAKKVPLQTPRAVTTAEAPTIQPASESSKETMMPWKGWVARLIKERLGEERYQALRQLVYYRPDDIHDLNAAPNPSTKVPINKEGTEFRQFRYPSPGSEPPVRMPTQEPGTPTEDPYNISYYTRDTGRRGLDPSNEMPELKAVKLELLDQDDQNPDVRELKEQLAAPQSSPGNQGRFATGPTDFDPTGLRATMSTNHAALEASLDANMPDHLPYPVWYDRQEEVVAWYKERDLPVPFGEIGFGQVPKKDRVAKW
jgi:hypothetical protein